MNINPGIADIFRHPREPAWHLALLMCGCVLVVDPHDGALVHDDAMNAECNEHGLPARLRRGARKGNQ